MGARLSPLDDSFLAVESPTAHMHVAWAAAFKPPARATADRPRFAELRDHIAGRLCRAPRYRQRIARVPFGLNAPIWVDDDHFDLDRHVIRSNTRRLADLVDECTSRQLPRDRPLWQICVADELEDGRIGAVGKAHHCMVDGIAAVELATLLLDPTPEPPPPEADRWRASPAPGPARRLVGGVIDRVQDAGSLAEIPLRLARSPGRLRELPGQAQRAGLALAHSFRPTEPVAPLNEPISPARHLAGFRRPFADLKEIGQAFGATVNDVLLAVSAGGMRRFLRDRERSPSPLKTMVPVNVRGDGEGGALGNRISFVFVDLPCDEPDPVRRLRDVQMWMKERKEAGEPEGANAVLKAVKLVPRRVQHVVSRMLASPRTFNLTVSNIPGPREPMYMLGCELEEAYPVVPIADRHALSIGMTTIKDSAFFVLSDRRSLPDADRLAEEMDASIDELLERV
jgi:diacylglycerol O-acyltransferase / wax synthase